MDTEIERRKRLCLNIQDAEWEDRVAGLDQLREAEKAYLQAHPPGLVAALWDHFAATRDRCGCATPRHERPGCSVPLIERLLLDEEELG